jgi:hypothetical protein
VDEPGVYRASPYCGILPLVGGSPFFAFGLAGLAVVGWESWYFFGMFAALGGLFVFTGLELPFERLVVGPDGFTMVFWFDMWKRPVRWVDIDGWLATPFDVTAAMHRQVWDALFPESADSFFRLSILGTDGTLTGQAVVFRVRGWRWPIVIQDYQRWQPNLGEFAADVRRMIPEKEVHPYSNAQNRGDRHLPAPFSWKGMPF